MRRILIIVFAGILFASCGSSKSIRTPNLSASNPVTETPAAPNPGETPKVTLPVKDGSVRFAVLGDTGTGASGQLQVAEVMAEYRSVYPFEFVLLLGDNLYGGEDPDDYTRKFERPYKELIDAGVKFYASLGNHDNSNQRFYKDFNMNGKEYYTFKKGNARFFALNSNYMDPRQIEWLEQELANSGSDWKICFFHHPLYSSGGKHGPDDELRRVIEPTIVKNQVNIVLAGHEHFYERLKPQKGVYHFISGGGGKLRRGDVRKSNATAKAYDQDLHFMLVEIADDQLYFQVISRTGKTVDSGVLSRQARTSNDTAQ